MNCPKPSLLLVLLHLLFPSWAHAITLPQDPPAVSSYSPIGPVWKVSDAFGPRYPPSAASSRFHAGLDLNQDSGNNDLGVMLKAREGGDIDSIQYAGIRSITISGASGDLSYLHIFDDGGLPRDMANDNVLAAGYSNVRLTYVNYNDGTAYKCGAIRFFALVDGVEQIQKLLTASECSNATFTFKGKTVSAETHVEPENTENRNDDIAPLGTSGGVQAHLHLSRDKGQDNVQDIVNPLFYTSDEDQGLIANAPGQFTVELNNTVFTPTTLAAMTNGPGFALKVTEYSMVPVLDKVKVQVPVDGGGWKTTNFSFGGKSNQGPVNTANAYILIDLNLDTGSQIPAVKPINWTGSGTAREMWFFVPHATGDFATLPSGREQNLKVTITKIDDTVVTKTVPFTVECLGNTVMWNVQEWQQCGSRGSHPTMGWAAAGTYCADLIEGGHDDWVLPTIDQLRGLIMCSNGTQVAGGYAMGGGNTAYRTEEHPTSCFDGNSVPFFSPTIDQAFSSGRSLYWSSTTYTDHPDRGWFVNFDTGTVNNTGTYNNFYARCVRGGP